MTWRTILKARQTTLFGGPDVPEKDIKRTEEERLEVPKAKTG